MRLHCVVKPKSRADTLSVNADGSIRVKIKALPVEGKANEYLVKYLASFFDLPPKNIQIISGFTSSHKKINIVAEDTFIQNTLLKLKS